MNTRFAYCYRDGDNFKGHGDVVASGTLTEEERTILAASLLHDQFFMAHQVGFPEVFLYSPIGDYEPTEMDHTLHELYETSDTSDPPTDSRTAFEIVVAFAQADAEGWDEFSIEQGDRSGVGRAKAYREGSLAR